MFYKVAIKSVKASFRDYLIYFITLAFSVTLFYTFNSIQSQPVIINYTGEMAEILKSSIWRISIFISIILSFLIIYSNNFLIKRRKKEFGIYLTLGMSRQKISQILLIETTIIGTLSLIIGLIAGLFTSQCLSILLIKTFNLNLSYFRFILSFSSIVKTILCFGIIFGCVTLFNTKMITKIKLIDLIYNSRKNEELKFKNEKNPYKMFSIGLIMMSISYFIIFIYKASKQSEKEMVLYYILIVIAIILIITSVIIIFMSLGDVVVNLLQSKDDIYIRNLNMFTVRQVTTNINTNFIIMSIVSLMLTISICSISLGIGIKKIIVNNLNKSYPYDTVIYIDEKEKNINLLEDTDLNLLSYVKDYVDYNKYKSNIYLNEILTEKSKNDLPTQQLEDIKLSRVYTSTMPIIKVSDFNKLMKLQGKESLVLKEDETIILSRSENITNAINKSLKNNQNLKINTKDYKFKQNSFKAINIDNSNTMDSLGFIILNDKEVKNLDVAQGILVLDTNEKFNQETINKIKEKFDQLIKESNGNDIYNLIDRKERTLGTFTSAISIEYLSFYVGIIFFISSGAILAIQQLSEINDNLNRYNILHKLGIENKIINKSMFLQISIYFLIPLFLAIINSIVCINEVNEIIFSYYDNASIISNSFIIIMMICMIYILYFIATYISSKNNINNKIKLKKY